MTIVTLADHRPLQHFGAANALTLARGAAVATLAGFLAGPIDVLAWVASLLGFLCIVLDGVDGWLARRFATVSPFGARFDMEVDAFLMLVLGLLLVASGTVGALGPVDRRRALPVRGGRLAGTGAQGTVAVQRTSPRGVRGPGLALVLALVSPAAFRRDLCRRRRVDGDVMVVRHRYSVPAPAPDGAAGR